VIGGEFLFFPGVPSRINGPISNMRVKNLRDGMEDYEYLALLEKRSSVFGNFGMFRTTHSL